MFNFPSPRLWDIKALWEVCSPYRRCFVPSIFNSGRTFQYGLIKTIVGCFLSPTAPVTVYNNFFLRYQLKIIFICAREGLGSEYSNFFVTLNIFLRGRGRVWWKEYRWKMDWQWDGWWWCETSVFKHPFHYVTYEGLRRCLTRTSHDEGNKKHFIRWSSHWVSELQQQEIASGEWRASGGRRWMCRKGEKEGLVWKERAIYPPRSRQLANYTIFYFDISRVKKLRHKSSIRVYRR